jgi:hypothetical protein
MCIGVMREERWDEIRGERMWMVVKSCAESDMCSENVGRMGVVKE